MSANADYASEEMMTIAAARTFRNGATCFVGVGLPSAAACLARSLHAPDLNLVYESGVIGAKPNVVPLSVADPKLAETADFLVGVNEIFSYWLQGGRIDMGFLGAGQIDRHGNINSTVIGNYDSPKVRMPGAGGAPHVAAHAREIVVIVRHDPRIFVSKLDFLTTARCKGGITVITDLGILEKDPGTEELVLTSHHVGAAIDKIRDATGWPLRSASEIRETPAPTPRELKALRELTRNSQPA